MSSVTLHVPPGGGPPPHRHDFEETFVLLGELEAIAKTLRLAPLPRLFRCCRAKWQSLLRRRTRSLVAGTSRVTGTILPEACSRRWIVRSGHESGGCTFPFLSRQVICCICCGSNARGATLFHPP